MVKAAIGSRRSAIEIAHEILAVCDNGGVNKTAIMYRNNLSYSQLQRYLALLSSRNLLWRDDRGYYQVTSEGQTILKRVSGVLRNLRDLSWMLDPSTNNGDAVKTRDPVSV